VNRAEVKSRPADSEKIGAIYQLLFQRDPATEEVEMARAFLQKQASRQALGAKTSGELSPNDSLSTNLKPTPFSGWEQLTQVFLLANELIFVD
jgi:hypothetical protein